MSHIYIKLEQKWNQVSLVSILGPAPFNIFINYLEEVVETLPVWFTDGIIFGGIANLLKDRNKIQNYSFSKK